MDWISAQTSVCKSYESARDGEWTFRVYGHDDNTFAAEAEIFTDDRETLRRSPLPTREIARAAALELRDIYIAGLAAVTNAARWTPTPCARPSRWRDDCAAR